MESPVDDILLSAAVVLLALSQVFQKRAAVNASHRAGTLRGWLRSLAGAPLFLALAFVAGGTVLWLIVLYRMDLSRAYPFLGAGTVLVVALSRWWLGERVSAAQWFGVGLIAIGVSLVGGT
jgi:drug/metabolite transporter (DMT)-like permease